MKKIKLESRYRDKHYLEEVSPNRYKLILDCEHVRFGLNPTGGYAFVDPSGGPFMSVGSKISDLGTIREIECIKGEGIYINFTNDISSNSE